MPSGDQFFWGFRMGTEKNETKEDPPYEPWPVPDRATMEKRWKFREAILSDTKEQRRIHPHGGLADTGRSILLVLRDRERRGASGIMLYHSRQPKPMSKGDRSPSTVFDSPVSTTQTSMCDAQEVEVTMLDEPIEEEMVALDNSLLRRVSYPLKISHEIRTFGEYCSTIKYHSSILQHLGGDAALDESGRRPQSSKAVSTISIAFSPDARTMASTHGDHTVKISCCNTGSLLESLEGHPRTPWTVKYHPTDSRVVASGCLGHQVRIWNWEDKTCLQMVRLDYAIISLSFHPSGELLAVANGTRLHFWGIDPVLPKGQSPPVERQRRSTLLTDIDQRHMLRCVHFPPSGRTIIIGGVNAATEDPRRRTRGGIGGGGMSFYLRLWDFDLPTALSPTSPSSTDFPLVRRSISNPRTFVPRALLYNDGGFDVSPDGKTLCACAEYWLPEGVDSAVELLRKEELEYDLNRESHVMEEPYPTEMLPSVAESRHVHFMAMSRLKVIVPDESRPTRGDTHTPTQLQTPSPSEPHHTPEYIPRTPPIPRDHPLRLSPPSPPGRRFPGGLRPLSGVIPGRGFSTPPPPPPPPPPAPGGFAIRPPHPLSVVSGVSNQSEVAYRAGRYVPHVVTVSLDTSPLPPELELRLPRGEPPGAVAKGHRPRLGQLLEACPLDPNKASAVTCVKFSPSTDFCLIGYGVREPAVEGGGNFHPVTSLYRVRGGMTHISTMLSGDDDVNIARFHPDSGHGFVYGTKQGRVRVLGPVPWNYYHC